MAFVRTRRHAYVQKIALHIPINYVGQNIACAVFLMILRNLK
jgi:hypothetical protein